MEKRNGLRLGVLLLCASAGNALALDNNTGPGGTCGCICTASNGMSSIMNYDSHGYACSAFENRTCNVEDDQTHLIVTGQTWGCTARTGSGAASGATQNDAVLDPGAGGAAQPRFNGAALPGLLLQRQ